MASTEIDINKLLVLVQARPPLYNMSIKDYHNKDVIEKLWEEIGQELNTTAADCKIKWHNLRSSYARYLRTMKNNGGRKKKWYLAEAMEFLKEHIGQHKKTSNNIQREESEDEDQVVYTEFNEDNSSATSEMLSNNEDLERLNKSQRKRSKRLSVAEHLAGPMAAYIAARIENSTEVDRHETSPMLHFFKGILPDIEQLTPRRQRIFKEETLRLINKLVDEQEYEEFGQL